MKGILVALLIVLGISVLAGRGGFELGSEPADARTDGATSSGDRDRTSRWRSGCSVIVVAPGRDRANGRVVATAQYRCERPGGEIELTLYLQRQDATRGWVNLEQANILAAPQDTTLDRSAKKRTMSASTVCVDGVYRSFARGVARIKGRSPQTIEESSSPAKNPCRGLRAN